MPTESVPEVPVLPLASFGDPFGLAEVDTDIQTAPAEPAPKNEAVPSLGAYGKAFFPDIADGTKRIFSSDIAPVALIGVGLTGLAFTLDSRVDERFQKQQPLGKSENTGDKIGQGYYHVAVGFALLGVGEIADNKQLADTGAVSLQALLVNGIATEGLKYATQRKRPNGGDKMSFPSGHASSTATLAASISEMYDWNPWLAVPLYATTVFVGASRIQAGEHHLSDVVAGMTLGTVVGMSFGRSRKEKNAAAPNRLSVAPYFDGAYKGVAVNWRF